MKRNIYLTPRKMNHDEIFFKWLVETQNGELTDKDLAQSMRITEREVRKIAERFNNFILLDFDNSCRYSKVDSKYTIVEPNTKLGDKELQRGRYNFVAEAKRHWNREKTLGNKQIGTMTLDELMKEYEVIDNE